jgi:hypothetical protein
MVKRYDHVVEQLRSIIREQDKEVERMKKKWSMLVSLPTFLFRTADLSMSLDKSNSELKASNLKHATIISKIQGELKDAQTKLDERWSL